jgi:hypothetical protein
MELEGSLPCPQEPSTGPYLEPDESSPYPLNLLLDICFSIILPSMPTSFKWSLSFRVSYQNFFFLSFPMRTTIPVNLTLINFFAQLARSTYYKASYGALFSSLLLLPVS